MNILFLGETSSPVYPFLVLREDRVVATMEPLTDVCGFDWIVSHGYRHKVAAGVLEQFPARAVNLHIGYLPQNRGADPNLWSIVEGTVRGVTVHHMDEGIDTGDIIAHRTAPLNENATLREAYADLQRTVAELFMEIWPMLRDGRMPRMPQGEGTTHRKADRAVLEHRLSRGWDTPVRELHGLGVEVSEGIWSAPC